VPEEARVTPVNASAMLAVVEAVTVEPQVKVTVFAEVLPTAVQPVVVTLVTVCVAIWMVVELTVRPVGRVSTMVSGVVVAKLLGG
jgi:hypothetical protein